MTDPAPASAALALLVAAGLGLRHAFDPDHLVAVADLAADRPGARALAAARVGAAWGLGHAISLSVAGLAVLRLGWALDAVRGDPFERAVGVAIVLIGVRLFVLQQRRKAAAPGVGGGGGGRLRWAFGTGLVHGLAGSGGVTLALLPLVPARIATPALLLFAGMTAVSMTLVALTLGAALERPAVRARFGRGGRRGLAIASIAFGIGYAALA